MISFDGEEGGWVVEGGGGVVGVSFWRQIAGGGGEVVGGGSRGGGEGVQGGGVVVEGGG